MLAPPGNPSQAAALRLLVRLALADDALFLTVAETAPLLKVCEMTVRRRVRAGLIPSVRMGRFIRIPLAYVASLLEEPSGAPALWEQESAS